MPPTPFSPHTYFLFDMSRGIGGAANTPCVLTYTLCFVSGIIGNISYFFEVLYLFLVSHLKIYWLYRQYPLRSHIYIYIYEGGGVTGGVANTTCAIKIFFVLHQRYWWCCQYPWALIIIFQFVSENYWQWC